MPDPRVARSHRRSVAKADYGVTMDRAFAEVMSEWWSGIRRRKDWGETTSGKDEPDCPIPPGGIENYLEALPDDTVLVRVCCYG
ncbi:hypothetical protein ACWEOI_19845 [Nocardia sp. NPDC004340]